MPVEDRFEDYNSATDVTSHSLVDAMMNGEEAAWRKIAEVWGRTLLEFFGSKGLQKSDCEEVAQNVLVKMYSAMSRGKFERDGKQNKLKHWVYKIAANELKTFYKRFHNKPKSPGGSVHQEVLANLGSDEETTAFEAVLISKLLDTIKDDFEATTWEAFRLHHFENVATPEIGQALGIKPGTVRQKIFRVKQRLKQELEAAISVSEN